MDRATMTACPAPAEAGIFSPTPISRRRHLLGLEGLTRERIVALLDAAARYRERLRAGRFASDALRGFAVCNAFFEDSTRTRISFELAEQRLGAFHVTFGESG